MAFLTFSTRDYFFKSEDDPDLIVEMLEERRRKGINDSPKSLDSSMESGMLDLVGGHELWTVGVFNEPQKEVFLLVVMVGVYALDQTFRIEEEIGDVGFLCYVGGLLVHAVHGADGQVMDVTHVRRHEDGKVGVF
ncbi:uncharacterized protein ACLA_042630 [Aspergillus clavatus NRRL 1]|uniref:Uncharacterized protein n=1 Tax=Aspergillus clavatus (strain ATCC 1007 / CBS 513.65 / DSM 816 / NCTC 3887 / NRRL 1 / QM 1276 / 107) TaxID=344612 RepID=A1CLL6_ASPCL|nr:uncharacterized protein ACLA_042630 [Aspergillus clavatus NRRL 1]EAW10040.1 hypothetical protein ACLA_042630 [Aspergillus clavatus NRRL 1]